MNEKIIRGIIGITDEGQPIVTPNHLCPYFIGQATCFIDAKECQYCKFADFRKTYDIILQQSICRCPQNRVKVVEGGKNEVDQRPSPLFESFVANIKGGIITCIFNNKTRSSKAVYINEGWTAITGYTLDDLNREMDGNPQAAVYPADKAKADLEYAQQLTQGNEYALTYRVIRKGGTTIWVIDRGVASLLPNGDIQNQSIVTEVTEIKEQAARLQRLAQLDQLTGLYNKVTFTQQTQMVLAQQYDRLHAMMILDIDDFKKINDNMGHAYGDQVLQAVGTCLQQLFRKQDVLGRIGGDEFMVLMTGLSDDAIVKQKANKLCATMRDMIGNEHNCCAITVSVGIAFSCDCKDYDEMFKQADTALYRAKNNGKNQYFCF